MNKLVRVRATRKRVKYILDNLRLEDKIEAVTVLGKNYKKELLKSILFYNSVVGADDKTKKPVLVYGACPLEYDKNSAIVYMISTDEIKNYKYSFIVELKKEIKKFDEKYYYLCNIIFNKNFLAKKWLKAVGFKFDNPKPPIVSVPVNFEYFYRIRQTDKKKGLG